MGCQLNPSRRVGRLGLLSDFGRKALVANCGSRGGVLFGEWLEGGCAPSFGLKLGNSFVEGFWGCGMVPGKVEGAPLSFGSPQSGGPFGGLHEVVVVLQM